MVPTAQYVQALIAQGEGAGVIFLENVPSFLGLGQAISALANANGGTILIGVRPTQPFIVGVSWPSLSLIFDRAIALLNQVPNPTLHQVTVNSRHVGVLFVPAYPTVVATAGGAFIRDGQITRQMTQAEIAAKAAPPGAQPEIAVLAAAIVSNTTTIVELRKEVAHAQSFAGQWKMLLISFFIGCVTGVIGNYLFKLLGL